MAFLRGDTVFFGAELFAGDAWVVLFFARLGALDVVLDFFPLTGVFLVLLAAVLRAIALMLTFHWYPNYSMRDITAAARSKPGGICL